MECVQRALDWDAGRAERTERFAEVRNALPWTRAREVEAGKRTQVFMAKESRRIARQLAHEQLQRLYAVLRAEDGT
jgi:hypothetical protein